MRAQGNACSSILLAAFHCSSLRASLEFGRKEVKDGMKLSWIRPIEPVIRRRATISVYQWIPAAPVPAGPCSAHLPYARFHGALLLHGSLPAQSHIATSWARPRSEGRFGPGKVTGLFA